jgi:glycosyltransferase involved in cell wall biosynthesis
VIGLGESARKLARALDAAGIPYAPAAIDLGSVAPAYPDARAPWLADAELPFDVTVLWCNPDRYGIDVDPVTVPGRRVGRWAWELPALPDEWIAAAGWFDEIWTPSRFVADAIRAAVDLPVSVIPMPIERDLAPPVHRERWGVAPDRRLFLYMFDYHSTTARKNPLGTMKAFARAFPDDAEATLIIKTINAADAPAAHAELEAVAAAHPAIRIADLVVSGAERSALLAGCDCYVSLHRSEGFGMTIAEAMAHGRPVIATRFGGNTEYMSSRTGYLVRWTPTRVGEGASPYPADGQWADPDLEHAASLMRAVVARPAAAAARGRLGARRIARSHDPVAVGRAIERRLARMGR